MCLRFISCHWVAEACATCFCNFFRSLLLVWKPVHPKVLVFFWNVYNDNTSPRFLISTNWQLWRLQLKLVQLFLSTFSGCENFARVWYSHSPLLSGSSWAGLVWELLWPLPSKDTLATTLATTLPPMVSQKPFEFLSGTCNDCLFFACILATAIKSPVFVKMASSSYFEPPSDISCLLAQQFC